jgi:uncharacterized RDD family membrane protein YckC
MHTAPLRLRFTALFLDFCIIVLYALCLLCAALAFYQFALGSPPNALDNLGVNGAHLLGFITLTLPVGLYFFFTETSQYHATFGKRVVKIKVSAKNKKHLSKKQIVLRTVIKLLPWEFAHTFIYQIVYYSNNNIEPPIWVMVGLCIANILPLVYVLMILCRKDRAGPHDLVAKTLVTMRN